MRQDFTRWLKRTRDREQRLRSLDPDKNVILYPGTGNPNAPTWKDPTRPRWGDIRNRPATMPPDMDYQRKVRMGAM